MQGSIKSNFNRDSSWEQVIAGCDLSGRLAVVTGGTAGLGLHTAKALGIAGADIFIGSRSAPALATATQELKDAGVRNIFSHPLDLADSESVSTFAASVLALERPLHYLIANAGVMATPLMRDGRGNEFQFSTNYLGHALLVSRLASALAAADGSRVISLSSTGHHYSDIDIADLNFERRTYDKWVAYGQSKTACSLLAVKVAKELGRDGVSAFAVHPGMIQTNLSQYLVEDDFAATREKMGALADKLPPFKTLEAGASTSVWAATEKGLDAHSFAYCEDCNVAEVVEEPNYATGVLAYAIDEAAADALWREAEVLLGEPLPLRGSVKGDLA